MSRRTKLSIVLLALAVAGAVTARTLLFPPALAPPVKAVPTASANAFDHEHRAFDAILKSRVKDGLVDYPGLKSAPKPLIAYLGQLAAVTESEFDGWDQDQQLAMLINLYNAATLKLVIDHHPVKSIKKIGGLFKRPWDIESLTLFGKVTTLNHLEHEILRKRYDEPRIHFAIVCAAMGCPALRASAYSADGLDSQLNEQGKIFLRDPNKNRIDPDRKTVYLSKIFDWFEEDFDETGSVIDFVKPFFDPADAKSLANDFKISYTDYDWSLNQQ